MSTVTGLVPLALSRIGDLRSDDAKEAALRVLLRALGDVPAPLETLADAFERMLSASRAFGEPACRARAFSDVCAAIACSPLPLGARRDLLERSLNLALASVDAAERVASVTAVLDARLNLRWGERAVEVLEELHGAAAGISDAEVRGRALLALVTSLANAGEPDRALAVVEALPASGRRALGLARVAVALERDGLEGEGATLFARALDEIRAAPSSLERAQALRALLAHAVTTPMEFPRGSALAAALDVTDALGDGRAQEDALVGAVEALSGTALEKDALGAALARLDTSIERVGDVDLRVGPRARLAVTLAELGDPDACLAALRILATLVARLWAEGAVGPGVALPVALPILEILCVLVDDGCVQGDLERFATSALDLLAPLDDHTGVAVLLGEMTRFFASPALAYAARVTLLERTLAMAQGIPANDARVEIVAHVANAFSIAGATERGDALFAGLVSGVGPVRARPVRLSRAVALVRLGRTADARAEIAAAAAATTDGPVREELASTMARCGFLADMLAELDAMDAARQPDLRAQLADSLVEATYLDPHLREIGLSSLLGGTAGPVRDTIACLLDQVRVLEGLGDVEGTLARAFARTATLEDRRAAAIFDRQLVDALIERIRCAPQQGATSEP